MKNNIFIITAAGGNATAIQILSSRLDRQGYANLGKQLMSKTEQYGVEQGGFLIENYAHFEMSGGEFCGNAARAVAIIFSQINNKADVEFTMSGFSNPVTGKVESLGDGKYDVACVFQNMSVKISDVQIKSQQAKLVDLGGIVHVVINAEFPKDYEVQHRQITKELGLIERGAVGVCWASKNNGKVTMHPVVWVKGIDSFFYETSCGSGSIAVGKVFDVVSIIQPTQQVINVSFDQKSVILQSEMEVTNEFNSS